MADVERLIIPGAGVRLVADAVGAANAAPTLLFLHGSGQTRQSWGRALEEAARRGYRALSLDLRGHGDSDWAPDGKYTLESFAADIRQAISYLGGHESEQRVAGYIERDAQKQVRAPLVKLAT